jgi:hypothetical protein
MNRTLGNNGSTGSPPPPCSVRSMGSFVNILTFSALASSSFHLYPTAISFHIDDRDSPPSSKADETQGFRCHELHSGRCSSRMQFCSVGARPCTWKSARLPYTTFQRRNGWTEPTSVLFPGHCNFNMRQPCQFGPNICGDKARTAREKSPGQYGISVKLMEV